MKVLSIVGARPNFMKIAPLHRAFQAHPGIDSKIVHTGQHYDVQLSDVFFSQLDLPQPDYHLGAVSGTPTQQTADIMLKVVEVIRAEQPDWVLVVGDVTSTLACALAAVQSGIRVAHVEAGLRSGDRRMPEEINRIVTDSLSELLFVTEPAGLINLGREGIGEERIHFVGNVMIDALTFYRPKANALNTVGTLGLANSPYVFMTMHRPANVDTAASLALLIELVATLDQQLTVVFPLHPRTRQNLRKFKLMAHLSAVPNVCLLEPQGYLECLNLIEHAAVVITDSGGIQEETTYLNVPCLTLRPSTERPITVELGTNRLIPNLNPPTVYEKVADILDGRAKQGTVPPLWDGQTAGRIAQILLRQLP